MESAMSDMKPETAGNTPELKAICRCGRGLFWDGMKWEHLFCQFAEPATVAIPVAASSKEATPVTCAMCGSNMQKEEVCCNSCQPRRWMTESRGAEAMPSPAPGPSCTGCGAPMVLRRIFRCPACGSTPELTDEPSPATPSSDMKMEKACARKWLEVNSAGLDSERQFEAAVDALALHIFHYIVGWDDEVPTLREQENFRVEAEHRGAEVVYEPLPAREETIVRAQRFLDDQGLSRNILTDHELINLDELLATFYDAGAKSSQGATREETPATIEKLALKYFPPMLVPAATNHYYVGMAESVNIGQDLNHKQRQLCSYALCEFAELGDAGARSVVVAPQTRPDKGYLIAADELVASRTSWLKQHGVPISTEFVRFAEAIGDAVEMLQDAAKLAGVAALPSTPKKEEK